MCVCERETEKVTGVKREKEKERERRKRRGEEGDERGGREMSEQIACALLLLLSPRTMIHYCFALFFFTLTILMLSK